MIVFNRSAYYKLILRTSASNIDICQRSLLYVGPYVMIHSCHAVTTPTCIFYKRIILQYKPRKYSKNAYITNCNWILLYIVCEYANIMEPIYNALI